MTRHEVIQTLIAGGAVAVIRMSDSSKLRKVAKAIQGGNLCHLDHDDNTERSQSERRDGPFYG